MSSIATPAANPAVTGWPRRLLQAEGAALFAAAALAYAHLGGNWLVFAALFLSPDLAMLGYLAGPRFGSALYNTAHTTVAALALGAVGWALSSPWMIDGALILAAHIGFDRALGYGLKYGTAFGDTHLGTKAPGR